MQECYHTTKYKLHIRTSLSVEDTPTGSGVRRHMGHIKRKNKVDPGAQILQLLKENHEERNKQRKDLLEINKNRDDGDVMFMMSFVPNLRQLDPVEKCEVKSQISNLFLDMEKKKIRPTAIHPCNT